jgi:hypothetical protein
MVPPELASRAWFAVRTDDTAALLRWLGRTRRKHVWLDKALQQRTHWVLVEDSDWLFLFSPRPSEELPPGFDPVAVSRNLGEVCRFTSTRWGGTAARYRKGALVRRVSGLGSGHVAQQGRPGQKREPGLAPFTAETVLGFAEAWHCDPRPLLRGRTRAWLIEGPQRAPYVPPRSYLERSVGLFLLVLLLGAVIGTLEHGWTEGTFREVSGRAALTRAIPACQEMSSCEMCTTCETGGPRGACTSQRQACEGHEDCSDLSLCFAGCDLARMRSFLDLKGRLPPKGFTLDFRCDEQCIAAHPAGARVYRAWRTCASCTACADLCAWQVGLGVGDAALADCAVSHQDMVAPQGR